MSERDAEDEFEDALMPIIYHRETLFPKCRHCGERMDYWIPGLADEKHAHPGCEGRAMANSAFERVLTANNQKMRNDKRTQCNHHSMSATQSGCPETV